jgi:hypothetical protein
VQPDNTLGGQQAELPATSEGMVSRIGPVTGVTEIVGISGANVYRSPFIRPSTPTVSRCRGRPAPARHLGHHRGPRRLSQRGDGPVPAGRPGPGILNSVGAENPLVTTMDSMAFIGFPIAEQYFAFDGHPTELCVRCDPTQVNAVYNALAATVNPENPSEVSVGRRVGRRAAGQGAHQERLQLPDLFLGLGAVALLVGGVGIANVMVISVLERRSEIGLRRALGATRRHVAEQFLCRSPAPVIPRRPGRRSPRAGWPPLCTPSPSTSRCRSRTWPAIAEPACTRQPGQPASPQPKHCAQHDPRTFTPRRARPWPGSPRAEPASGATQRRKRWVFYNAFGYAVGQGHLSANLVGRIQWTTPAVAQSVDRRVVVSPAQAKEPAGCRPVTQRPGAAPGSLLRLPVLRPLRPSEAVMLRETDLHLLAKGWGRIDLAASASRAGTAWTDHETARQERGLKHRAAHETRAIHIPPEPAPRCGVAVAELGDARDRGRPPRRAQRRRPAEDLRALHRRAG